MNRKGEMKRDNNPFAHSSYPRFNGGPKIILHVFGDRSNSQFNNRIQQLAESSCNQSSLCSVAMTPLRHVFVPSDWKHTCSGRGANGYTCWAQCAETITLNAVFTRPTRSSKPQDAVYVCVVRRVASTRTKRNPLIPPRFQTMSL